MNYTELLKKLRELTAAGMKDCRDALIESENDLDRAIDIIKTKGLNIVSGREGKIAADGRVEVFSPVASFSSDGSPLPHQELAVMIEVNCQTDFNAKSNVFIDFCQVMAATLAGNAMANVPFEIVGGIEQLRQKIVATTKENIVVRRWWVEEALDNKTKVFSYVHSNNKIAVLLTLSAPSEAASNDPIFVELGNDLAMQVAAMNPLVASSDRLSPDDVKRQVSIFETQLNVLRKPQSAWAKIIEGKTKKWHEEVCLLNQESIIVPKTTVQQVIKNVGTKLGGEIIVVNFVRCEVGQGLDKQKDNLPDEVAKMVSTSNE